MKTIENTYKKLTQLEHILLRPDTYVGSIESVNTQMWIFDDSTGKITQKEIKYIPGLYKIFDEVLVNAADNFHRDRRMTKIDVSIDKTNGSISISNNGKGIPVQNHSTHKMYIPELIFGNLLTSSNFDDDEKKIVGGRNGYGAKLANIFSSSFSIVCCDHKKKKYEILFLNTLLSF